MKIGFLITYFYPKTGGAENNCYYLARELAKRHEVHVFCSGDGEEDEVVEGINIHRSREVFRLKYYFAFYPSIVQNLIKYNLDVLHVHGFGFIQHDYAVSRLKKANPKIKIVCTPHGPFMALNKYSLVGNMFKKFYTGVIKKSLKNYDIVIKVNPNQDEWLISEYGIPKKKIKFLPNGLNREAFEKSDRSKIDKIKKKYNLKDKFVISYLGRIQKYKGIEQIVDALPELKMKNNKVALIAMGRDVGDRERLEGIAKSLGVAESVLFTGEVSESEKRAILDCSDVFVFPSEWEAFGIVVLEAMARGLPVISTKTEGGKYLIKDRKNGFIFDYGNIKKLTEKIEILIDDKKLREKIKNNNILKAKKFIWEDISKELERIYKRI